MDYQGYPGNSEKLWYSWRRRLTLNDSEQNKVGFVLPAIFGSRIIMSNINTPITLFDFGNQAVLSPFFMLFMVVKLLNN